MVDKIIIAVICLSLGVFIGLLTASLITTSKRADEDAQALSEEYVGCLEDDGR